YKKLLVLVNTKLVASLLASDFPSENPRPQTRNFPYTNTLYAMKKNLLTIFILTFTILACKENSSENKLNETIEYYANNPKVVFKKTIHQTDFDSIYFYYDNGKLFKEGKQNKENKIFGIWKLYDKESNLREIREWFIINDHSLINRVWFLDKNGDTLAWNYENSTFDQKEFVNDTLDIRASSYDIFDFNKDTISINEPVRAIAYCNSPQIREYNSQIRIFLNCESENLKSPFPNDSILRTDYYENLSKDTINQKWFSGIDPKKYKYVAVFGARFKTTGEKLLRGYMEEYAIGPFKDNDYDSITSRKYFEKRIYVKDVKK
uniref:hypothetical protein n=1 Tax=Confluentibacter lentus TaxID=1699412 RepID=UPI000C294FCE